MLRGACVYLCTCLLVYLSTCLPVYLFTCLPVYLFTCVPVYLCTCLPVYLFSSLQMSNDSPLHFLRVHVQHCDQLVPSAGARHNVNVGFGRAQNV